MLCYKQYPLQDEHVQAAQQVTDKYQWMRAKLGQPTISCLKNRTGFLPHFQVAITQRGMFSSSPSLSSDSENICFPFSFYLSNIFMLFIAYTKVTICSRIILNNFAGRERPLRKKVEKQQMKTAPETVEKAKLTTICQATCCIISAAT